MFAPQNISIQANNSERTPAWEIHRAAAAASLEDQRPRGCPEAGGGDVPWAATSLCRLPWCWRT